MKKEFLVDELGLNMQQQLVKQASGDSSLVKAAECLHSALEILEEQGLKSRADQLLQVMEKIATLGREHTRVVEVPSFKALMEKGFTQRDLHQFQKGNPIAKAKLNLILRQLGLSEHHITKFIGPSNVMSEEEAKKHLDPGSSPFREEQLHRMIEESIPSGGMREFDPSQPLDLKQISEPEMVRPGDVIKMKSIGQMDAKKPRHPGRPDKIHDPATKGLTPEKEVANIKHHGTPFNMADDIEASDDPLMDIDVADDSLEVIDKDIPLEDFEDERD